MKKQILYLISIITLLTITGCGTTEQDPTPNSNEPPVEDIGEQGIDDDNDDNDLEKNISDEEQQEETQADVSTDQSEQTQEQQKQNTEENPRDGPLSDLKVHYIDVGQADATLLQYDAFTILIDAGDWNSNNVVNYLHAQNISEIDVAIGTHPDADHIGQLDKVINQFDVGEVWLSGNTSTSQTFERLMLAIDASGAGYDEPRTGDVYDIGDLKVEVLYPRSISGKSNEESISLKLTYGEIEFIFTGDAGKVQEQAMINAGVDLEGDILQLGHHGSKTSTSQSFIEAVSPEVAIYSAGKNNSYGHPHDEVINTVKNYGAKLYGTDVHGTIIVTTNGVDYQITTKQDGNITPSGKNNNTSSINNTTKQQTTNNKQSTQQTGTGNCIDINTASLEEVQGIIHIGPARAEDLINLRPFQSIDGLSRISGIGPARVADIKAEGKACIGG